MPKKFSSKRMTSEKIKLLRDLMRVNPTLADTSFLVGVPRQCIEKWIKENYDMTFYEFRDAYLADLRKRLVNTATEQALSGENNTMLIFCLKNLCGWSDKKEVSGPGGTEIKLKYSIDSL